MMTIMKAIILIKMMMVPMIMKTMESNVLMKMEMMMMMMTAQPFKMH